MVNRGIKERLGQEIKQGRPKGVFSNPYNVPAQQFYKIQRQKNRQINNLKMQEVVRQEQEAIRLQRTPNAFEQRAVLLSDTTKGDINSDPMWNY